MWVDWVEPFSNHLQMKSCPGEGQTAWCIAPVHKALTGILDVLFWVEIIEFCFPFWQQTSGLYFERMLVLKPVKLCQSWSRDLRVCSAASFVSGLIVAREKILHLPTRSHNAYTLSFFSCISLFLYVFSLSPFLFHKTPSPTQTCCIQPPYTSYARMEVFPCSFLASRLRPSGTCPQARRKAGHLEPVCS